MNNNLKNAFTLIELLVVIAIIGILSGLIIVGMSASVDSARIAKSKIFTNSLNNSLLMYRIAEWKFDETSGTTTIDTVGNYGGTLTSSPVRKSGVDCVSDGCLEFDGVTNSYVEIPDISQMPLFSLSAWVYNVSGGDSRHSILRNFWEVVDRDICYWSYNFANTYWRCTTSSPIGFNKWTLVVTTWDGSVIRHYIDGQLTWTDSTTSSGSSENITSIAGYAGRIFKGRLDDIRVYNKNLSLSNVNEIYWAGITKMAAKGIIDYKNYKQLSNGIN